ncbi:MAG TPA: hypothetical protein VN933_11130 [Candidatus Eremiobacteraceae bacterium]|jgi:hypothetical protein|nr:hypothetical protein [Candidatus Eremiobacteraceae bacterium]
MKRAIVLAVFCLGLVGIAMMNNARGVARSAGTGGTSAVDAKTTPISNLAWLVGGVWTADASKMGDGMKRIETRYVWSDNNAFIRFTTHFVSDKGTAKTYDGNFFWEPAKSQLAMWYMDYANEIVQGPVAISGETTKLSFHATDLEGKPADMQVELLKKSNDKYQWTLEEKIGDSWKQLATLEYVRTAD